MSPGPATTAPSRCELRSPDCTANPYLAFALLIWAGLEGLQQGLELPEQSNVNLFTAEAHHLAQLQTLSLSRTTAARNAAASAFVQAHLPQSLIDWFCRS